MISPVVFAGINVIGFEGGHGTAAGMADVFKSLGYPELIDLTPASATVGILFYFNGSDFNKLGN